MPAAFDKCREAGGRIRTKSLKGDKYIHICYQDGKAVRGEVKVKKSR